MKKPKIAIVGEFQTGKSTLVNLLFGREVAQIGGGLPCTALATHYRLDREELVMIGETHHKIGEWINSGDIYQNETVVKVGLNHPLLLSFDIIDTPGVDAAGEAGAQHEAITFAQIEATDAFILLLDKLPEISSETGMGRLITKLRESGKPTFGFFNCGRLGDTEHPKSTAMVDILAATKTRLKEAGFPISIIRDNLKGDYKGFSDESTRFSTIHQIERFLMNTITSKIQALDQRMRQAEVRLDEYLALHSAVVREILPQCEQRSRQIAEEIAREFRDGMIFQGGFALRNRKTGTFLTIDWDGKMVGGNLNSDRQKAYLEDANEKNGKPCPECQVFRFEPYARFGTNSGYLVRVGSGKVLDYGDNKVEAGLWTHQWEPNDYPQHSWSFERSGEDFLLLCGKNKSLLLESASAREDLHGASVIPAKTAERTAEPTTNQLWEIVPVQTWPTPLTILDAKYGAGQSVNDVRMVIVNNIRNESVRMKVGNDAFGDPSPGTLKYLTVTYLTSSGRFIAEATEGELIQLPDKNHRRLY